MERPTNLMSQIVRAFPEAREADEGTVQTSAERWQSDATADGSNRRSHWPARSALATVALGLLASGAMANWMWLPREQVTFSADSLEGAATQGGAPGRSSGLLWHQTFRTWEPDSGANHAIGYYVPVGPDWDVVGAWANDREAVTFFQADSGHRTTDIDIVVDEDDDVYVVAEIWNLSVAPPSATEPRIGYRHRTGAGWSAQYIVSPDPATFDANTPHIHLQEGSNGDTLHVSFLHPVGADGHLWYTRRATDDAEDAWDDPIFVTSTITASAMEVDGDGAVHFFGKERRTDSVSDSTLIWAFVGTYSNGAWTEIDSVLVSRHSVPLNPVASPDPEGESPTGQVEEQAGVFYWVWSAPTWNGSSITHDLFSATRSLSGTWSAPDTLTAIDSSSAFTPRLVRSGNGTWHIIYTGPSRPPALQQEPSSPTGVLHMQSDDFVHWSAPEVVSLEQRTVSFSSEALAVEDTVFVTYTSHDDDDPTPGSDGDYEVWSQKGYALADSVSGTTETWRGAVYLDRDVVVKAGATLTIEAGTRIFARANTDLSQQGEDDGRVEIVVLGTLVSQGTAAAPIEFGSFGGVGAPGEWYGIRTTDPDRIEGDYVTIRNARGGLSLQSAAFPDFADLTSRGFVFEDNVSDVGFDRDVAISSTSVTIPAGWRIGFTANHDADSSGADSTRAELIVSDGGRLTVEGTSSAPVWFVSDDPNGGTGGWFGMRFALSGCGYEGAYGYVGCVGAPSAIENAVIGNAQYGVIIEDHTPPTLEGVTFTEIMGDRHIFLKSDVVLPQGFWDGDSCGDGTFQPGFVWDLEGGTHVVASTSTFNDVAWVGVEDKNDLVVFGKLFTDGSAAAGDMVFFGPDDTTDVTLPGAGTDWGGVLLSSQAAGSKLRWADIGYAANPVFVYYPDSLTEIAHSRIHHFADVGMWVQGAMGLGGQIDSCLVDRGATLYATLGGTGIYLDKADEFTLRDTQVLLHGRDDASGGIGVLVGWGKTFCESQQTPPSTRSLLIHDNFLMGPATATAGSNYTGLRTSWVCGSEDREVDLIENWVEDWKFAGMDFVQTADVQVDCNKVVQSDRGVDVYRDSEPTGSALRFKKNEFEALRRDPTLFGLRTNDAAKTKLGPAQADRADNILTVNVDSTRFIFENDSGAADTLDTRNNYWQVDSLGTRTLLTSAASITSRIVSADSLYKIAGFRTEFVSPGCGAVRPGDAPEGMAIASGPRGERVVADERALVATGVEDLPLKLELGRPYPNPGSTGVTLTLSVPKGRTGTYILEVFDIGGRRVLESRREIVAPGRYPLRWSGRDAGESRVAGGVYFLRLRGPGSFVEMRKVTVVQ